MLCFCKFVEVVSKYRKRQYGFTELLNVDPSLTNFGKVCIPLDSFLKCFRMCMCNYASQNRLGDRLEVDVRSK
jgi:hypothetical protein